LRAGAAARTPSSTGSNPPGGFKAPLLERLLEPPEPERRTVILDLGGTSTPLLERLADRGPCRVEIADFASSGGLSLVSQAETPKQVYQIVRERLLPISTEPADLIFCWDLPNYIGLDALRGFFAALGTRAAPGCRLHTLIAYANPQMRDQPGRFVPYDGGRLIDIKPSGSMRPAPRYSPEDLGRAVSHFRYERGMLLANGMQEFVYVWPE
jgi:hypothetical protein